MIAAVVHGFCDSVLQDASAADNADCDDEPDNPEVQHPHNLYFVTHVDCVGVFEVGEGVGAKLIGEDDLTEAKLEVSGKKVEITDIPAERDLRATVHTFAVGEGDNDALCAILVDNLTNEEEEDED